MIRLSVAVAAADALPSAFVVWRGFESSIAKAAALGYDGVELALKQADEIDPPQLRRWLDEAGLAVSCISTGQVFAGLGLSFTDPDPQRRTRVRAIFEEFIDLATEFGRLVNIGRVRGRLGDDPAGAEARFVEMARNLCDYAAPKGVGLILEPVNRYEIDFINSLPEGADLMRAVDRPNMKLMPDVFHMNIEDVTVGGELRRHIEHVAYVHLADSNRLAPGRGHTDFADVFGQLQQAGFDGWCSVEILPKPDPDAAARQAVEYLKPFVEAYNAA